MTGFTASLLWMMFVHSKESVILKVCQLIFGVPTLSPQGSMLEFVDPIIVALPLAIIATIVGQMLSVKKQFDKTHVDACFEGLKEK